MGIFSAEQQHSQEDLQWCGCILLNKQPLGKSGLKLEESFQSGTCPAARATQRRPELPPAAKDAVAGVTQAQEPWPSGRGSQKGHLPTYFMAGKTKAVHTA